MMLIAILGIYVTVSVAFARHYARSRWEWAAQMRELAQRPNGVFTERYARLSRRGETVLRWDIDDGVALVGASALVYGFTWAYARAVGLAVVAAFGVLGRLLVRPTSRERRARKLAAAKHRVAELERELGIEHENTETR